MIDYSSKVLEFATKFHDGQVRKFDNSPYINHPIAVAKIALELAGIGYNHRVLASICYLHDVVEDTPATITDVWNLLLYWNVPSDEINEILTGVKLLTKPEGVFDLMEDYLKPIKENVLARFAKRADLKHNMSDLAGKNQKMLDKYKLIEYYLTH